MVLSEEDFALGRTFESTGNGVGSLAFQVGTGPTRLISTSTVRLAESVPSTNEGNRFAIIETYRLIWKIREFEEVEDKGLPFEFSRERENEKDHKTF